MPRRGLVAALLLAAAVASLPYARAVSPYWNISPDSATFVGGAKSLAAGNGYGHLGRPIRLQPPGPALIYAATLLAFPDSYLALRVVVVVSLMVGLGLAFVLMRREVGAVASLAAVVASLGSAFMLSETTRLLSEPFYLCFSMAALLLASAQDEGEDASAAAWLALALLAAVMTRTVGLVLPCAILLAHGLRVVGGRERWRPGTMVVAVGALAAIVVWDLASGRTTGLSYFTLLGQKEIWVTEAGTVSPLDFAARLIGNLPELARIGRVLDNDVTAFAAPLAWVGTVLFVLGLGVSCARGATPVNVYLVVYLLVCLSWPEVVSRFLTPVVPLLFLYAGIGLRTLTRLLGSRRGRAAFGVSLALWAALYVRVGWPQMRVAIAEEHRSPFADSPIKYPWNYDGERLAFWLRDHTAKDTVYASPFPDVYDFISERQSIPFPLTRDAQAFLGELASRRVAYVLVSLKEAYVREYVLPIVAGHPERFLPVETTADAALYAFR